MPKTVENDQNTTYQKRKYHIKRHKRASNDVTETTQLYQRSMLRNYITDTKRLTKVAHTADTCSYVCSCTQSTKAHLCQATRVRLPATCPVPRAHPTETYH